MAHTRSAGCAMARACAVCALLPHHLQPPHCAHDHPPPALPATSRRVDGGSGLCPLVACAECGVRRNARLPPGLAANSVLAPGPSPDRYVASSGHASAQPPCAAGMFGGDPAGRARIRVSGVHPRHDSAACRVVRWACRVAAAAGMLAASGDGPEVSGSLPTDAAAAAAAGAACIVALALATRPGCWW